MNKLYFILFTILLSQLKAFSTNKRFIDSCEASLKNTTNISQKINCLYTLSYEYGLINPRKGIFYAKSCIELSKKTQNLKGQLDGFNGMGNAYESMANYDSARWCHLNSYYIAKKIGTKQTIAATLFNVATCLKEQGKYREALNIYLEAFKTVEHEKTYNPRMHYYLGEMYLMLSNYDQSIYHSKLGYQKCAQGEFEYVACNMNVILAKCKLQLGQVDSAVYILKNMRTKLKNYTDQISYGISLNALGEAYVVKKNYTEAINCFKEELAIHEKLKNPNGICLANLNLAHGYALFKKQDVTTVSRHLQIAENNLCNIEHNKDALMKAYNKLAETYELVGLIPMAFSRYKMYSKIKDELLNLERFNQLNELQTKYDSEKKIKQINDQKADLKNQSIILERNRLQIISLLAALAGFVLFAYLFYNRYKLKQKMKLLLEIQRQEQLTEIAIKNKENEERSRIAKDIHDELGSGLTKIRFMSELAQKEKNVSFGSLNSIAETSNSLVENMRDLIWLMNPDNASLENLVARIREHSSQFLEDFGIEVNFDVPDTLPLIKISKELNRSIFMVIKEALNNIAKHSKATLVKITMAIDANFNIEICDNGNGKVMTKTDGNGLKNMEYRIKQLNGNFKINFTSGNGTSIYISTPL